MLKVTSNAKNRIKRDLHKEREDITEFARVIFSPSNPSRIGFEIDREKEDDMIIKDNDGEKLLLLSPDMLNNIGALVLDYVERPDFNNFILSGTADVALLAK